MSDNSISRFWDQYISKTMTYAISKYKIPQESS